MDSAEYVGFLLNCPIGGDEWTTLPTRGQVRNRTPLELDGRQMALVQSPALIGFKTPDIWGQQVHTTDLIVPGVTEKSFLRIQRLHQRLAELLMFATQSEVRASGYRCDAVEPSGRVSAKVGVTVHSIPVIDANEPGNLRSFLESSWRGYLRERRKRRLHIVFEYSVQSQKAGQPIEMKLVTAFVMFECLKYTYALQKGYPFVRGRFRERSAGRSGLGKPISFKRLTAEMLAEVGLRPRLDSLVSVRNELVHSGLSSRSFNEHRRLLGRLQDITRRYVLRLLGYRGQFVPFSGPNSTRTA